MPNRRTTSEIEKHIDDTTKVLKAFLKNQMLEDENKTDKLCYWLNDYLNFLSYEKKFDPKKNKKYKRGEVIKAHLGFRIGSEEGGMHYCVVLDVNNALSSPVITVVPLTSIKQGKDLTKLKKGEILLGEEIFNLLTSKMSKCLEEYNEQIAYLKHQLETMEENGELKNDQQFDLIKLLKKCEKNIVMVEKIRHETTKMKRGSIALVAQITTISKIRIYDPKNSYDVLSNIIISNESLDKIDKGICELYTKN